MVTCNPKVTSGFLRFSMLANLIAGVAFVVFGFIAQSPPTALIPIAMVVLGFLSILAAVLGCAGSYCNRVFLMCFLILGFISTGLQIAVVVYLFVDLNAVLNKIVPCTDTYCDSEKHHDVKNALLIGRWVLLVLVIFQGIALMVAVILKYCFIEEVAYEQFDNMQREQQRATALTNLKRDVEKGAPSKVQSTMDKTYDRIRERMASKYGHLSNTIDWAKKGVYGKSASKPR